MFLTNTIVSQTPEYRNAIDFTYSSLRFQPHEQYLGFGLDYRFIVRPTLQMKLEATAFPGWQSTIQPDASGRQMNQFSAAVLAGHRWGRFSLLGEAGFGDLRAATQTTTATSPGSGTAIWVSKHYPELILGGMVEISVSDRMGLTYEVRNDLAFIRGNANAATSPNRNLNIPEGKFGLAYHFQQVAHGNTSRPGSTPLSDETNRSHHAVDVIYSTLHWSPYPQYAGQQWLGLGLRYRYISARPFGVQLEGTYFPQTQTYSSQQIVQAAAVGLIGHRWGRLALYGEAGIGVLRMHLYGALSRQNLPLYLWYDYPDLPVGAAAEVRIGRRWALNYEFRDNVVFFRPSQFVGPSSTVYGPIGPSSPAYVSNLFQASSGLSLRF